METKKATSADRREFYRVSCAAAIEIQEFLSSDQDPSDIFSLPPESALLNEFRAMSSESGNVLKQISDGDKNLGAYLKILNKKLDLLAATLINRFAVLDATTVQEIDISEGGIQLTWPKNLVKDSRIAIKLTLLPDSLSLLASATVKSCRLNTAGDTPAEGYLLNVEFIDMDTTTQQLISRYIRQQQRRAISSK
jgi:hypothetical protein